MTNKQMANEIKKLLKTDPKSLYDKPVTVKFNSYEYQMLKELSEIVNEPISRLVRKMVYYTLLEMKDLDKIN